MNLGELRKWLAFGTGIGVEIRGADLHVMVVKVRPSGADLLSAATIEDFRGRPAAEWGANFASVVKKQGAGHLPANVLLPREEVIVRQINLPGVSNKDLQAAIRYQIDSLHPYAEDEAVYSAVRVGGTSTVLVGITRRQILDQYLNLFTEAGIKVASFAFSAAAIYSALRLVTLPPATGFLALQQTVEGVEVYGESESKPIFSAMFPVSAERAGGMAAAELRLPPEYEPVELVDVLPYPKGAARDNLEYRTALAERALPYAAALFGACPRLSLSSNLLSTELRSTGSRLIFVPTVVLATVLGVLLVLIAAQNSYYRSRYLATVNLEIQRLEPVVNRAGALDKSLDYSRKKARMLDDFRRRSKEDMDAISELTNLLAPPAWVTQLDITRTSIGIGGEAEQAAPLIKQIDSSKLFENSEFTMPIARVANGEAFRIRASREGVAREVPAR